MKRKLNVALVCMPFYYWFTPSIPLASLKSFIKKMLPQVNIDILNFHLKMAYYIGLNLYAKYCFKRCKFFVESLYASLLFPEIGLFYEKGVSREEMNFFLNKLKNYQEELFEQVDWSKYDIIGFTISEIQLLSSLYLIKKIKKRFPDVKIVAGGANVIGEKGKSLMEQFKEIDLAISGEGELNFYHILKSEIEGNEDYKKLKGIIYRENEKVVFNQGFNQLEDLNDLEFPDYSDYFRDLEKMDVEKKEVIIPLEFSRGCFYNKCSFCALKKYVEGYRMKKVHRILEEIKYFNKNYGVNEFCFCDSILPEIKLRELFEGIKKLNKDMKRIELSSKSSLCPSTLKKLSESRVAILRLGVETLSSSLLKKMNKPSNLMYNVQSMKMCELYHIFYTYNIIYNYPLTTKDEIEEILKNIELIKHFKSPKFICFRLQEGCDIYNNPEKYEIKILGNKYNYRYLFPPELRDRLNLEYKEYEIEKGVNWKRVIERAEEWRKEYNILKGKSKLPILYHFKKGDKTTVIRRKTNGKDETELNERESRVYEYCDTSKSFEEIKNKFRDMNEMELKEIIKRLKTKRLFFESDDRFLSLSLNLKHVQIRKLED